MNSKKVGLKNALLKSRAKFFAVLVFACINCSKAPIIKVDSKTLELCEAWNSRQRLSQIALEGSLNVSSKYASGSWDIIAFIEQPNKVKILFFEPFFGMESGRLESTERDLRFYYGKENFKIKMPPEILVQALMAKPDCSLVQSKRRNLSYELKFDNSALSSWTVWKNSTIIGGFFYVEGFEENGDTIKPIAVEFFWSLGEEAIEGMIRLTYQPGGGEGDEQ